MKKKLKTFKVKYTFDGYGEVEVEAKNEEEARDKFYDGEWSSDDHEEGSDYEVETIKEIKKEK